MTQKVMSTLLPESARLLLIRAAAVDQYVEPGMSVARTAQLEAATETVHAMYPKFFKEQ